MILLKEWARHKVRSFIYCVIQFFCEKPHKKWNQECKQKQSCSFVIFLIFWPLELRPRVLTLFFTYFPHNERFWKVSRNFIHKFLFSHTSLWSKVNFCTKYNVRNALNLLHMTRFQGYLFAEGTYTALEFYIHVN